MNDRTLVNLADVMSVPFSADYVAPETHSWQPQSLVTMAENPPEPPTIGGLLYPGKRTVLSGETESMKTWLALILCKAELDAGFPVAWADLDAMGPGAMLERLTLLGCSEEQIHDGFLYYQPSEMLDPEKIREVSDLLAAREVRLCVIDAFNPFLSLHGLEPNSTPDIDTFWRTIADPICAAGAAPVLLDHVVKNAENRGKYAYGSERKASGAIVHIGFRLLEPLTKGGKGRTLLTVHKDRPGYLPRPVIGRLALESVDGQITFEIQADHSHDKGKFQPTIYMERVSRKLEPENNPVTGKWLEENVEGQAAKIREAIKVLIDEGYVIQRDGERGAHNFLSVRAFREGSLQDPNMVVPGRPEVVPNLSSSPGRPPVSPLRGRGTILDELAEDVPTSSLIHEYDPASLLYLESIAEPEFPDESEPPSNVTELW